ncbi:MAG: hypothetical protein ACI9OJ_003051 [Myxococcota bacterium]|jgi:hypothetical protein
MTTAPKYFFATSAGALVVIPLAANAAPLAASVGMPSQVVAGLIVGLILLAAFVVLMVRTFKNMQDSHEVTRQDEAVQEVYELKAGWEQRPTEDALHALVDGLRESSTPDEAALFASALAEVSGRYFGADDVAWEVWVRREGASTVAALAPRDRRAPPAGEVIPVS